MDDKANKIDYRCIQCGFQIKTLYIQYSPGNIRLMRCENCKSVADEYIECELMILLIDLILQKQKAYRHLFYNKVNREIPNRFIVEVSIWFFAFGFICLVLNREEWNSCNTLGSALRSCLEMFTNVVFGNIAFLCTLLCGTRILLSKSAGVSRCGDIFLAIFVSSYFKIFLVAMMIWEFPSSVIFIIDMFVLSSNTTALKVMAESTMTRCLGVCFSAHAVKFIVGQWLNIHPSELFI